jgi:hypothetical protein
MDLNMSLTKIKLKKEVNYRIACVKYNNILP